MASIVRTRIAKAAPFPIISPGPNTSYDGVKYVKMAKAINHKTDMIEMVTSITVYLILVSIQLSFHRGVI